MTSMDGYDDHSMFDELNSLIDPSDLEDDSFNESFDDMGHDHPFADPFVDPIADDPAVNIPDDGLPVVPDLHDHPIDPTTHDPAVADPNMVDPDTVDIDDADPGHADPPPHRKSTTRLPTTRLSTPPLPILRPNPTRPLMFLLQGRSPHWMMMACTATPTSGTLTGSTNR